MPTSTLTARRLAGDKHVLGAAEHHAEIFRLEGQAHAEHDDAQQRIDEPGLHVAQRIGKQESRHR